ncbi:MAG: hypothetical protein U0235_29805 [Polyangiaceae bacterium]
MIGESIAARLSVSRLRIGIAILAGSDASCGSTGEFLSPDESGQLDAAAAASAVDPDEMEPYERLLGDAMKGDAPQHNRIGHSSSAVR